MIFSLSCRNLKYAVPILKFRNHNFCVLNAYNQCMNCKLWDKVAFIMIQGRRTLILKFDLNLIIPINNFKSGSKNNIICDFSYLKCHHLAKFIKNRIGRNQQKTLFS